MAKATLLGFPRIGQHRELKFAVESFWDSQITEEQLIATGAELRKTHLSMQSRIGIDLLVSNDFSFYDQVLDMSALFGVVPGRYGWGGGKVDLTTYFAMARGVQKSGLDVPALEMTKWFDTNYHYIVPLFETDQKFKISANKPIKEFLEAKELGYETRPVFIGPVSFLLLGKNTNGGSTLTHLDGLLQAYGDLFVRLEEAGATWVQLDEPFLVMDLEDKAKQAYQTAYQKLRSLTKLKLFVTTPYGSLDDNLGLAASLPIDALHVDLVRGKDQLEAVLAVLPPSMILAAGVIDGRNIWLNDLKASLQLLERAVAVLGSDRVWVCPSCSLLHVPYDLDIEQHLDFSMRSWMSFAKKKLDELAILTLALNDGRLAIAAELTICDHALAARASSPQIHSRAVSERLTEQPLSSAGRAMPYAERSKLQRDKLKLPMFPTTTIGSFPQTAQVRKMRADWRNGRIANELCEAYLKEQIKACIAVQE